MFKKTERGQSIAIFAVALVGLLAFVGLATDVGQIYIERRNAQSAADSAAFAGAAAKIKKQDWTNAALKTALNNGYNNDGTDNTVSVYSPPNDGPYALDPNYVQVIISSTIHTSFLHMFAQPLAMNTSQAVVQATTDAPLLGKEVLYGANKSACDTVSVNGSVKVTINNGNVFSNSSADGTKSNCNSMTKSGSDGEIHTNNGYTNVVGSFSYSGALNVFPAPSTGVIQKNYPVVPAPNCSLVSNFSSDPSYKISQGNVNLTGSAKGTVELQPGVYGNISINSNPTVVFKPGLYCINGNISVNGGATITGSDVLIVMNGGSMDFSGANVVDFKAHSSTYKLMAMNGQEIDYKGLIFYADPSKYSFDSSGVSSDLFKFNGSITTNYVGTIYAPKTDCALDGNPTTVAYDTQMICNRITIGGNSSVSITLNAENQFHYGGNLVLMQ